LAYGTRLGTAWAELGLYYKPFSAGLGAAGADLTNFVNKTHRVTKDLGTSLYKIGAILTTVFTLPIILLGKRLFNTFVDFQRSMANTASVVGSLGNAMAELTAKAEEAGATTVYTASQAGQALYYLASAGYSATESIAALDGVLDLAAATQSELAFTSERVATTISQFGLSAGEALRVANVFSAAISGSQATMTKLADSMRYAGTAAGSYGRDLEETTGNLMALFNAGLQGSQAGVYLRSVFQELASPTNKFTSLLSSVDLTMKDVNPTMNSMADIVEKLSNAGVEATDVLSALGRRGGQAMAILMNTGAASIRDFETSITGTNKAAEMMSIQMDTLSGDLIRLRSVLEGVGIRLLRDFEPTIRNLVQGFTRFLEVIRNLPAPLRGAIVAMGATVAALGPLILILKTLATLLGGPVAWGFVALTTIVAGFSGAILALGNNMTMARDAMSRMTETAKEESDTLEILLGKYNRLNREAEDSVAAQAELKGVTKELGDVVSWAVTEWDDYGDAVSLNIDKVKDRLVDLLEIQKAQAEVTIKVLRPQKKYYESIREDAITDLEKINKENEALIKRGALAIAHQAEADRAKEEYERVRKRLGEEIGESEISTAQYHTRLAEAADIFNRTLYDAITSLALNEDNTIQMGNLVDMFGSLQQATGKISEQFLEFQAKVDGLRDKATSATGALKDLAQAETELEQLTRLLGDVYSEDFGDKGTPLGDPDDLLAAASATELARERIKAFHRDLKIGNKTVGEQIILTKEFTQKIKELIPGITGFGETAQDEAKDAAKAIGIYREEIFSLGQSLDALEKKQREYNLARLKYEAERSNGVTALRVYKSALEDELRLVTDSYSPAYIRLRTEIDSVNKAIVDLVDMSSPLLEKYSRDMDTLGVPLRAKIELTESVIALLEERLTSGTVLAKVFADELGNTKEAQDAMEDVSETIRGLAEDALPQLRQELAEQQLELKQYLAENRGGISDLILYRDALREMMVDVPEESTAAWEKLLDNLKEVEDEIEVRIKALAKTIKETAKTTAEGYTGGEGLSVVEEVFMGSGEKISWQLRAFRQKFYDALRDIFGDPEAFRETGERLGLQFIDGFIKAATEGGPGALVQNLVSTLSSYLSAEFLAIYSVVNQVASFIGQSNEEAQAEVDAINTTISGLNEGLRKFGADPITERATKTGGGLLGLFGRVEGKKIAQRAIEAGQTYLASLESVMSGLGSALASAATTGDWSKFGDAVGNQIRTQLFRALIEQSYIGETMGDLVRTIVDATADGVLSIGETKTIKTLQQTLQRMLTARMGVAEQALAALGWDLDKDDKDLKVEHEIGGVQITRMAGEDRNAFVELLRPLTILDRLPTILSESMQAIIADIETANISALYATEVMINNFVINNSGGINVIATDTQQATDIMDILAERAVALIGE